MIEVVVAKLARVGELATVFFYLMGVFACLMSNELKGKLNYGTVLYL